MTYNKVTVNVKITERNNDIAESSDAMNSKSIEMQKEKCKFHKKRHRVRDNINTHTYTHSCTRTHTQILFCVAAVNSRLRQEIE